MAKKFGIHVKRSGLSTSRIVAVMNALSAARADAVAVGATAETERLTARLYANMAQADVKQAIRHELLTRMNWRIANKCKLPGDYSSPTTGFDGKMEHARGNEQLALYWLDKAQLLP
jgi:hypothetical protein